MSTSRSPRCPGEVLERLISQGWTCDDVTARQERNEYRRTQRKWQSLLLANGIRDELPPCYDCHPRVFKYCQDVAVVTEHMDEDGDFDPVGCWEWRKYVEA